MAPGHQDNHDGKGQGQAGATKPIHVDVADKAARGLTAMAVNQVHAKGPGQGSETGTSSLQENSTIKAVIDKELPDLPCIDAAKLESKPYYKTDASSDTTKDQTPPQGWLEEKETDNGYLHEYFSEFACIQTELGVPATEESHYLSNEGDVIRASTLYLLHPVNVAAQEWLRKKGDNRKLICTSETPTKETKADGTSLRTRTDIEWRLGIEESAPRVAVLEYKRKHTLNPDEINRAKFPQTANMVGFAGSSENIVKQATLYVTKHYKPKLNDVCVFDWDTLWIFNFEGWDENNPKKGLPKCVLHQERGKNKWESKQHTFRQLLLAFLIRALIRTNPNLKSTELPIRGGHPSNQAPAAQKAAQGGHPSSQAPAAQKPAQGGHPSNQAPAAQKAAQGSHPSNQGPAAQEPTQDDHPSNQPRRNPPRAAKTSGSES